jgi:hypothetical protein
MSSRFPTITAGKSPDSRAPLLAFVDAALAIGACCRFTP